MADFPTLRDGDALQPWHLNIIFRELERLRKMSATLPMAFNEMASDSAPPKLVNDAADQLVPVLLGGGGIDAGSWDAPASATAMVLGGGADAEFDDSASQDETLWNPYTQAIAGNKFVWACWYQGQLYVAVGDC